MAPDLRFLAPLMLAAAGAATLPAQQATWIVDSMGNFDFLTIQAAVNASSPGDVIVVLGHPSTVYPAFTTTIGVKLQGRNDPVVAMATVQNMPAGQLFSMECLQVRPAGIRVVDCMGTAHLERIGPACSAVGCSPAPRLEVLRSFVVTANECVFEGGAGPAIHAERCDVVLTGCNAGGADAGAQPATPALRVVSARVVVGNGRYFGGSESALQPAAPAVDSTNGILAVNGTQAVLQGGRIGVRAPAIATSGGSVRVDPRVTLMPSGQGVAIAGNAQVTIADIPFSTITVDAPGMNLVTGTTGFPNDLVLQALGFPGTPIPLPPFGDLWLDPTVLINLGIATADAQGRVVRVVPTPSGAFLEGLVLGLQSLVVPASGAPAVLSNPAFGIMTSCAVTD